jgi:hypothetical protein
MDDAPRFTADDSQGDVKTDLVDKEGPMWFGIGLGIFLYVILAITLGIMTLRKGHWVMFILGIFLPVFWLIGALIAPKARQPAPAPGSYESSG